MKASQILLLFFLVTALSYCRAEKYALVVAIGNYPNPEKNGWPKISAANDVQLILPALETQNFNRENIYLLLDSIATKAGILKAMEQLTSRVKSGDVVFIHFSCQGEQIEDDNGDETDGLDEAIVPYGAIYSKDRNRFAEIQKGYLRDDELTEKTTAIRNKLGKNGDLMAVLDVGFSATNVCGLSEALCRGQKEPLVSFKFNPAHLATQDEVGACKDKTNSKLEYDAAGYTLISAAEAKGFNFEYQNDGGVAFGSLTYSFAMALAALKEKITYRSLFSQIENNMLLISPGQKPQMEGDGIDRILWGNKFISQTPYILIKKWKANNECTLNAGAVAGINVGSVVSFYNTGVSDPTDILPLNKGIVTSTGNYTAQVKLLTEDTLFKSDAWAFVTLSNYGNGTLKMGIRNLNGTSKKLREALKDFPLLEFNQAHADLYLDTAGPAKAWALKYPNGKVYMNGLHIEGAADIENIKSCLKRFDRYRYLQGLNFGELGLSAEVSLFFVDSKNEPDGDKLRARTKNGRLELHEGDEVYLKVINTGKKKFFINILDLQPDGRINPIMPNKSISNPVTLHECTVGKNDTLFMKSFKIAIGSSYGDETFKIFLSHDPIDLEDVLTTGDNTSSTNNKGIVNNLATVLTNSEVKENGKRGGTGAGTNTDQAGTVFNLNFAIVPR